jgi:NDP-sugar pyrophosphorylase family protein
MTLPVAILAGGLATRLRPITETIPKSLVSVAGDPFIYHQLSWLAGQGIDRVVLCVGKFGEMIREYVQDGARWGLVVDYSFDGEVLLGTGGALRKAVARLGDAFFILYGDSYLDCVLPDIELAYKMRGKPALMTVLANDGRWDVSNARLQEDGLVIYDKRNPTPDMRFIDYGLSVMTSKKLLAIDADSRFDLSDFFSSLSVRGELAGYEVVNRFYEVGSPAGLEEAELYFRNRENA